MTNNNGAFIEMQTVMLWGNVPNW